MHARVARELGRSGVRAFGPWSGTQRGELMGIKPTNRRTVTHGCSVGQIKNGKAVHDWIYWDTGHLLRQLGVLPAA
jgi:predicted ester cyclase